MKNHAVPGYLVICGFSGLLGAVLTHAWEKSPAHADTPVELQEFTPEERVHISVYEQTNRSVVNIDTLMARQTTFSSGPL